MGANAPTISRLFIVGAGGSGREVAWLARACLSTAAEVSFLVDQTKYMRPPVSGLTVRLLEQVTPEPGSAFVISVGDLAARQGLAEKCIAAGLTPTNLIHPQAIMSSEVILGEGIVVAAGVIVTTNVTLGDHVFINLSATLSHDVRVGDYSVVSPGATIAGHVEIGRKVMVGAGATIINGQPGRPLKIGDGAVIAAGACVTRPVEAGSMVAGVPAVRKK